MAQENLQAVFRYSSQWHQYHVASRIMFGSLCAVVGEKLRLPSVVKDLWESDSGYRFEPILTYADLTREVFQRILPKPFRTGHPIDLLKGPFREVMEPFMETTGQRR